TAELAAEILQDGAGLEYGDGAAVRSLRIDDRRHPVVRGYRQERWLELLPLAYVDVPDLVGNVEFLEHDGDLPAVGGRPVVKLYRAGLNRHSLSSEQGVPST